jgi:ribosomal protein RSM22 (predicted rRNA methylase)
LAAAVSSSSAAAVESDQSYAVGAVTHDLIAVEFNKNIGRFLRKQGYRSENDKSAMLKLPIAWHAANQMPILYAVLRRVFKETRRRLRGWTPRSVFEYQTLAATAAWCATEVWGVADTAAAAAGDDDGDCGSSVGVRSYAATEKTPGCGIVARRHFMPPMGDQNNDNEALPSRFFAPNEVGRAKTHMRTQDLVVSAYALSSQTKSARHRALTKLWNLCGDVLILVETGDAAGHEVIKEAR